MALLQGDPGFSEVRAVAKSGRGRAFGDVGCGDAWGQEIGDM